MLAHRVPAALSPLPQQAARLLPTGNHAVDALLTGGLPLGSLCEVTGPEGSGRTSLALSVLAATSAEAACAYIDVSDSLSPKCSAAAGIRLSNLLWVRFTEQLSSVAEPTFLGVTPADESLHRPVHSGCGGSHPRGETKDLAPALEQMLFCKEERRRRKLEGTPGHPNQPLGLHTASKEQVDWERFNLRRVDESDPIRQMDKFAAVEARKVIALPSTPTLARKRQPVPLDLLSRALRATDQILQSGGFRVVVLDLGSTAPQATLRIPSATWFRFRRAAQESDAILLVMTQEPCARSSAACVLECQPAGMPSVHGVLQAAERTVERTVEIARQRTAPAFGKKTPGRSTSWYAEPAYMRAAGQ